MVTELKQRNLYASTLIIVTAKHSQSPTDHTKLVKNGDTLTALLEANNYLDPNGNFGQNNNKALNDGEGFAGTGMVQTDDVGLIWLRDQSQVAPTILSALDLDPRLLHAVQVEGTHRLPGLGLDDDK